MQIQTATQRRTPIDEFFYGGIAPILNIQAKYDVIAPPAYANVLSDYLGDRVTNVQIDHAGHALIPEQCQAVIEAILAYIRRTL
jgi:pimeloyl-ACP methyl ester carboxylesterase